MALTNYLVLTLLVVSGTNAWWFRINLPRILDEVQKDLDQDGDGLVTPQEIQTDLAVNFDANRDGCVNATEFYYVFNSTLRLDSEFLTELFTNLVNQYPNTDNACNGVSVSAVNSGNTVSVISYINTNYISPMITYCESNLTRYENRSSLCYWLSELCRHSEYACGSVCKNYVFVTLKGREENSKYYFRSSDLAYILQYNLRLNDFNNDSVVDNNEVSYDLVYNYDLNRDGCVDEVEFMARQVLTQCGGIGNSRLFAQARFDALASQNGNCFGLPAPVPSSFPVFTANEFLSSNINSTINACEAEPDLSLYKLDNDCSSLPFTCRRSPYKDLDVCKNYIENTIADRKGLPFSNPIKNIRFWLRDNFQYSF